MGLVYLATHGGITILSTHADDVAFVQDDSPASTFALGLVAGFLSGFYCWFLRPLLHSWLAIFLCGFFLMIALSLYGYP